VECDGAYYHSAKCARDRDRIRQAVLEGLGWRLHRIWSTDWWLQRPKQVAKLEDALERAKAKAGSVVEEDLRPPANVPAMSVPPPESPSGPRVQAAPLGRANVGGGKFVPPPPPTKLPGQAVYTRYQGSSRGLTGDLIDPANARKLLDLVVTVARVEAPLLFDSLCSEVASAWGMQRAGSRICEAVRGAVRQSDLVVRRVGDREFVWTKELAARPYEGFRVPDGDSTPRQANEICPEEVANAAAQILALHISMTTDDLARETAFVFGIRRLGATVRAFIDEGITLLKKRGRCRAEGPNLVVL
jgi:hypothetical protein